MKYLLALLVLLVLVAACTPKPEDKINFLKNLSVDDVESNPDIGVLDTIAVDNSTDITETPASDLPDIPDDLIEDIADVGLMDNQSQSTDDLV